jgi:hypothetical protein
MTDFRDIAVGHLLFRNFLRGIAAGHVTTMMIGPRPKKGNGNGMHNPVSPGLSYSRSEENRSSRSVFAVTRTVAPVSARMAIQSA